MKRWHSETFRSYAKRIVVLSTSDPFIKSKKMRLAYLSVQAYLFLKCLVISIVVSTVGQSLRLN
ncbi:hypothetical protein D3C77_413650 [compost metagenome]